MEDEAVGAQEKLWNVEDVSLLLGLTPYTVREWVRRREIPAIVRKRLIRFEPEVVRKWLKGFRR